MAEERDYLGDKLRLVERAREDAYFRKLDEELIANMRRQAAQEAEGAEEGADSDRLLTPVLVPVDFSPYSKEALLKAATIAERFASALIVLHVIPRERNLYTLQQYGDPHDLSLTEPLAASEISEAASEELEAIVIANREQGYAALQAFLPSRLANYPVELRVVVGPPFERIIETAVQEEAALIVMGTHGRTGLEHVVLGSVAERVVRLAPCPVMTVKLSTPETKSWLQSFYASFMR